MKSLYILTDYYEKLDMSIYFKNYVILLCPMVIYHIYMEI